MKNLNGKNGVYQSLQGNGLGMKGITLISLVVTIIVLLIIAGISISMLAGDNSILTMAGKAKEETKNTNELEQVQLAVTEAWMENSGTLYKETLKQKLEGKFNIIEGKNGNFFGDEPWSFIGDTSMAYEITGKGNVNIINIWNYNHNNQTVISNDGTILKIGDYIKLELEDTQNNYSGGWRVIGVEDKRLKLVSADLLNSNVTLNGRLGDAINEQGVAKVNDICNTYKNGKNVLEARSINVEDIDEIVGYNKSNFGKNEISQYGNVVTYRYTEDGTRYSGTLNSKEGIYKSSFMTVNGIYLNENNNEYTVTSTAYTYSGVSYLKNTSNEYNVLFNNSTGEYLNR